jgi:hypothetical protein
MPNNGDGLFGAIFDNMNAAPEWKPVDGVVAVHSASGGPKRAGSLDQSKLGHALSPAMKTKFEEAGWHFINADESQSGEDAHEVIVDKDGNVKIVGATLDVKFSPGLSSKQIEALLEKYGLAVSDSYKFSPNLFSVRSNRVLENVRDLSSLAEVEFAEPSLIEPIGKRSG